MNDYHTLVPLPPHDAINKGLSPAHLFTMIGLFGTPGRLTRDCSPVTNAKLRAQIVTHSFNNFTVTGWLPAVEALKAALLECYAAIPDLETQIRSAGMLCCRAVRGSDSRFSNHSFGTAIDLEIGTQLDPMGATRCQKGILMLYPFMHKQGFYWSAELARPDPQHFELADETVRRLYKQYYG